MSGVGVCVYASDHVCIYACLVLSSGMCIWLGGGGRQEDYGRQSWQGGPMSSTQTIGQSQITRAIAHTHTHTHAHTHTHTHTHTGDGQLSHQSAAPRQREESLKQLHAQRYISTPCASPS